MSKLSAVLLSADMGGGRRGVGHWCPACKQVHLVNLEGPSPVWTFDGNVERPTFSPSVRVSWGNHADARCCHYFVESGEIKFCRDSTHELAGQTVPLPPIPDEEAEFWS